MLSVGRIYCGGGGGVRRADDGAAGGHTAAPGGWRYLWEQVAEGAEDYYSADVARGESPGRWGGKAAKAELGLSGQVTEAQMERVYGLLMHPTENVELGRAPRQYRGVAERLAAATAAHLQEWTADWAAREVALVAGASAATVEAERAAAREAAGERWAQQEAAIRRGGERAAVAGFDLTFSPPKSVSVLWAAAPPEGREAIWAAHREAVAVAMGYVEREAALSRVGYNGIRQVDTTGLIVASFDHRMSRAGDVQIHTHNAVLNRVRCDDGEWRAVDGRVIYQVAASAGAIYERVREAALERSLGVRHEARRPGQPREIAGVDDEVCRLFSSRRQQIEGRLEEMTAAYEQAHGAAPSRWVIARMAQWATLETRKAKERTETTGEALARWEAESRAQLGRGLAAAWEQATAASAHATVEAGLSDNEALAEAVAAVDRTRSTWTRYDLAAELAVTLTVDRAADPAELLNRVDRLVERALGENPKEGIVDLTPPQAIAMPVGLRRSSDGDSVYDRHGARRYTTDAGLACELRVLESARRTGGPKIERDDIDAWLARQAERIGDDQREAVAQVLCSGRRVEALVGPAGTGKTYTMATVARAWAESIGTPVLGLAVAETAARALRADAEIYTVNTAKLLYEHQNRTALDQKDPAWQAAYGIAERSLVILDEAGMASRETIDEVRQLCAQADAKLLLVGDHEQLDSPEASGMFRLIVDQVGAARLDVVRRFAARWEAAASLRLRDGDPTVLDEYDLRGRICGGGEEEMEDAAFAAAAADRAAGRRVYLLADTNESAARLAGRTRDLLVAAGDVDDTVTVDLVDGNRAGRGDRIVTRINERRIVAGDQHWVANRDVWHVTTVHRDGSLDALRVDPETDQPIAGAGIHLSSRYVAEHVELEYAGTVHAAQSGTRTVSHTIVTPHTSRQALYVALTRGREENRAYVKCRQPEGADSDGPQLDPLAVLASILERDDHPEQLAALATRDTLGEAERSQARWFPIWQDLVATANQQRWRRAICAATGEAVAADVVAAAAWPTLAARLGQLDYSGVDSATAVVAAAASRSLAGSDDAAAVLHWRLRHAAQAALDDTTATFAQASTRTAVGQDTRGLIRQVAELVDARNAELGARVAERQPAWSTQLGPLPPPVDGDTRADWERRAGIVAGYREAIGLDRHQAAGDSEDLDPIGAPPPPGRPEAAWWWRKAAVALGRSSPRSLAQLPDERLEAIVEQARQVALAAPPVVDDQLRTTSLALRAARSSGLDQVAVPRLIGRVEQLEADHQRRRDWLASTAGTRAEADQAAAELATRAAARACRPHWDMDLADLHAAIAACEADLARLAVLLQHHQGRATQANMSAVELREEARRIAAARPQERAAQDLVADEQTAVARIRDLQVALGNPRCKSDERIQATVELAAIAATHPSLPAEQGRRESRWNELINGGRAADTAAADLVRDRLAQKTVTRDEEAAIVGHHQAERNENRQRLDALHAELRQRLAHPASDTAGGHRHTEDPEPTTLAALNLEALRAAVRDASVQLQRTLDAVDRHETVRSRWEQRAGELVHRLEQAETHHPETAEVERIIKRERLIAKRIDNLRAAIGHAGRSPRALPEPQRDQLRAELDRLSQAKPELLVDTVGREWRWSNLAQEAARAEQIRLVNLRRQLHEAGAGVEEHTALAEGARAALPAARARHDTAQSELSRRSEHHQPHETRGGGAVQPATTEAAVGPQISARSETALPPPVATTNEPDVVPVAPTM